MGVPGTEDVVVENDCWPVATADVNVCPLDDGGIDNVGDKVVCVGCCCWVPFGTDDVVVVDDDMIGYDATLVSGNLSFLF